MSKQKPFEHTVGQGKETGNTEEEVLKANEEFEKAQIENSISLDDNIIPVSYTHLTLPTKA